MNSNNTTQTLQSSEHNKQQWWVKSKKENGRIISVSPRVIKATTPDDIVSVTTNSVCQELIAGSKNVSKYAMHWDESIQSWDIDVKSTTLVLQSRGTQLNAIKQGQEPSTCDMYIKITRDLNQIHVTINFANIRMALNLGQINTIKNADQNLLNLYICKKNDPDYLIGIVTVDPVELLTESSSTFDVPLEIMKHINSWDDVSVYTKPVFKTYGIEFTDVPHESSLDNERLYQSANVSEISHINMYILNDMLIIDSKISKDMLYYFENKKRLELHISDTYVDNYVTTLTVSTNKLLNNEIKLDLPVNWPANPVFTFKNTKLTVNYYGENNEQHD